MRQDHYRRLHEACLAMANQSTEPEVQARWLVMADAWFKRSLELNKHPGRASGAYRTTEHRCGRPGTTSEWLTPTSWQH
jgi:hypothetical protein